MTKYRTPPKLELGTMWMLYAVDPSKVEGDGRWLGVFGWSTTWEKHPNHICPRFMESNMKGDFHLHLYSRFTRRDSERICVLAEVVYAADGGFAPTGRYKKHANFRGKIKIEE